MPVEHVPRPSRAIQVLNDPEFAHDHLWDAGIRTGLVLIAGSILWFGVALLFGRIPLFAALPLVIGIGAVLRGIHKHFRGGR